MTSFTLKYPIKTISKITIILLILFLGRQLRADAFELGMDSLNAGDFAEAFCIWRPLAMQGHVEAAYHLGWLYANGNGLRVNISKAAYWWRQSADHGHNDAMFALALAYTHGEGIKKDYQQALDWYLRAAKNGHEDAQEIIKQKIANREKGILPRLKVLLKESWVGENVVVSGTKVNLRSSPGVDGVIVKHVTNGHSLIAVDHQGDWYRVVDPKDMSFAWIADWLIELNH